MAEAIGAVSLAFQAFAACVKGYQLLTTAAGMPKEHQHLCLRLYLEQYRFLDWAAAAELSEDNECLGGRVYQSGLPVVASLNQIKSLLLDLNEISRRYRLTLQVDIAGSDENAADPEPDLMGGPSTSSLSRNRESLRYRALKYAEGCAAYPGKLRWVVFHSERFGQLLARLAELNTAMLYFLNSHQKRDHYALQQSTHMQLLHTHNKLEELIQLIQSINTHPDPGSREGERPSTMTGMNETGLQKIGQLAKLKALQVAVGYAPGNILLPSAPNISGQLQMPAPTALDFESFDAYWHPVGDLASTNERSAGHYAGVPVWVEWKDFDAAGGDEAVRTAQSRISRLSVLLQDKVSKPAEVQVPDCLGYIKDPSRSRYGLVFSSSLFSAAAAATATPSSVRVPQSLLRLLQEVMKPSLSQRVALAKRTTLTLQYLHAASWLHKGLRSHSILFDQLENGSCDLSSSLLSGFDYSRPMDPDARTELPPENRHYELYRHPDVQFDVPRDGAYGFAKEHDIFSLGVVLFEIGVWHAVHEFLGISLNQLIPRSVIKGVKARLLHPDSMAVLRAEAGEVFAQATMLCLSVEPCGMGDQLNFWNEVSGALNSIVV
ncbi:Prion-inhibition and propagation domain containing protein [Rhypophila decipiens]